MKFNEIVNFRLSNQHLVGQKFEKAEDAIKSLGAVQAQDYQGAKWGIAQRVKKATTADLDKLFNEGKILRTHIMRPTWHFVLPQDIRWLQKLTSSRVKKILAYYDKRQGVDLDNLPDNYKFLTKILRDNNHLTRKEISEVFKSNGNNLTGPQLAHILSHAELDTLVTSGPLKGKQFTYALLDERVPKSSILNYEESLAELAKRYFTSHGPATVNDFAWWSGLAVTEARAGVKLAESSLLQEEINNITYWFAKTNTSSPTFKQTIHLLPNYDEYIISYQDYSPIGIESFAKKFGNGAVGHLVIKNGLLIGEWRRTIKKDNVDIKTDTLAGLNKTEKALFKTELSKYSKFVGLPVDLVE